MSKPEISHRDRKNLPERSGLWVNAEADSGNLCRQNSQKIDPKATKQLEILLRLAGGIFIAPY
ncbi:hypothetical protein [Paraburkholderia sp. J7]|uniref:hypothetical protein n=1 Tax=Paraburkholderia sp. J7 TaxID=2805438 RepID=UPI002AB67F9A|nr:hypothetical protein [Paraburkholderia sp. J7]